MYKSVTRALRLPNPNIMRASWKKIVWRGIIILAAILVCIFFFRPAGRKEPVCRGKTLTQWLKQLDDGEAFGISSGRLPSFAGAQIEAAEAIRAIGTNALPFLLEDIHAHPSEKDAWIQFNRKLDRFTMQHFGRRSLDLADVTAKDRVRWRAAQGLSALGPLAKPAVPELTRLLFTNYFHSSIKEAAYALAGIGPDGIAVLTNSLQPTNEWSGMCAIWALGQHPAAGTNVIPFLISAKTSSSEGTACGAIQVLGLFHVDGEHVIPALTNALSSSNAAVRSDAARALMEFGVEGAK
jgi:HEAT repeat protein